MVISNSRNAGFFAELTTVIRHIKKVRDENKFLYVDWNEQNSLYYDVNHGKNVWEYYYETIDGDLACEIDYILNDYITIKPLEGLNLRQTFSQIYNNNIKLNQHTKNIIERNLNLVDCKTLGVHLRKTDKFLGSSFNEQMAIPVEDELVFKIVDEKLANKIFDRVFLATDCDDTYKNFKSRYGNLIMTVERIRGTGTQAIHTSNRKNGYIKGLESLIDSYILSKCGFLIRSTSNLSSFSMFLNLNLECVNINEIFRGDKREHEFNIYSKPLIKKAFDIRYACSKIINLFSYIFSKKKII
jgi:hypothetical protein